MTGVRVDAFMLYVDGNPTAVRSTLEAGQLEAQSYIDAGNEVSVQKPTGASRVSPTIDTNISVTSRRPAPLPPRYRWLSAPPGRTAPWLRPRHGPSLPRPSWHWTRSRACAAGR